MRNTLVKSGYSMTEPPVHALTQGELRISRIFSRAWNLFTANIWKLFIVTAISELPARAHLLWTGVRPGGEAGLLDGSTMRAVVVLLTLVLVLFGQAALAHAGFQTLRRQSARLHKAVQDTVASFPSILGLAVGICLLMFGLFRLLSNLPEPGLFAMVFMVGASVLFVRWSLAVPVCVVEGLGLVDSLGRSARLTKGHRWKIFGIIVLVCAPLPAATALLGAAMSLLGPVFQYLGQYVLGVAWIASFTSVLTVIYHDLRVANEGPDSGQIATVFD
jgi:Membrane domain of glycerophosphoryl diester phosphodiesterase